ncbi:MAG: hypothetical protein WC682_01170 [Parcubacteria group bacterium]|jgi:hypothetical protein
MKGLIIIFVIVGSSLGSYVPVLWGDSVFSIASILFSAGGGFAGIWLGYQIARGMGIE